MVTLDQIRFRTSTWVELHAWLAAAAREPRAVGDPAIEAAIRGYVAALDKDELDEDLWRTTRALAPCIDERCARDALAGTRFATPFFEALPVFVARHWTARATTARSGIEAAREAIGPELEPLAKKLAKDLAIYWPEAGVPVDVVSEAPAAGREAPIRALMAARGSCFASEPKESSRVHDARIMDCALAYAAIGSSGTSALWGELGRLLKRSELGNAWIALVVHASAATIAGWEPQHASVLRRSAAAVMPHAMEWLAREWKYRTEGEPVADFATRYAEALKENPR